jgi:hypothetical protein
LFEKCEAVDYGGAVYAGVVHLYSMTGTACLTCAAVSHSGFCVGFSASGKGALEIIDSAAHGCISRTARTIELSGSSAANWGPSAIDGLNSSSNNAVVFASGLWIGVQHNVSWHYSTLAGNTPANCLFFSVSIPHSDISCIALTNNTCKSNDKAPGFIFVSVAVAISNSVFQGNRYDAFVGGLANIQFIRCIFDVQTINKTGGAGMSMTKCMFEDRETELAECKTVQRRLRGGRLDRLGELRLAEVGGIVAGCVAVTVLGGLVVLKVVVWRLKNGDSGDPVEGEGLQ